MSEQTAPTIAERNAAARAAAKVDANSTLTFPNGGSFVYYAATVPGRKQVKEGGKKKMVETENTVVLPVVESLDDIKAFSNLVFENAGARAVELFDAIFGDHLTDASNESFDLENHTEDTAKLINLTISPDRPRSAGLKMEDINNRIATLTPEYMALIDASRTAGAWAELKGDDGAALFTSEEAYNMRLVNLASELKKLSSQAEEKRKKLAEIKAKREEKAAKAAAAAKQAAQS